MDSVGNTLKEFEREVNAVENEARKLYEVPEPGMRLDLERRAGDLKMRARHIHQVCSLHSDQFQRSNFVKVAYLGRNEQHFLWRDLPSLLDPVNEDSPIISWLREAFDAIGYVQPLGLIVDLNDVDSETRTRNRKNSRLYHILNTP